MHIQWDYPAPFSHRVKVEPNHIDGLNHTNNAVYIQWCEETAWEHSNSLGLGLYDYQELNRAMAITGAQYQYLAPSYSDDELIIGTWLTSSDQRLTLERQFQICRSRDGKTLMRGTWSLICINIKTGKPVRMPKQFIEAYTNNLVAS